MTEKYMKKIEETINFTFSELEYADIQNILIELKIEAKRKGHRDAIKLVKTMLSNVEVL